MSNEKWKIFGGCGWSRTTNLALMRRLLCRLSYTAKGKDEGRGMNHADFRLPIADWAVHQHCIDAQHSNDQNH
jgi:hypothetical protein